MAVRIFLGGVIASMAMRTWEMAAEAIMGQGFWSPLVYIAATILRGL